MSYQGQINGVTINNDINTPLITANYTDDIAGVVYNTVPIAMPYGFVSTPPSTTKCSYISHGDGYIATQVINFFPTIANCPNLLQGTPLTGDNGESALYNAWGITLKALQSGLISTFTGLNNQVLETKVAIDYNVIKSIIDILQNIVDFITAFNNHSHTGNNVPPTTPYTSTGAFTTDYEFFGSNVDEAPTYINSNGDLISK